MKIITALILIGSALASCTMKPENPLGSKTPSPIVGTWQLISGTTIEKGDTVITDYTKKLSFIKIINDTHFAFLKHDLKKGKDTTAVFEAGGGRYSLTDSVYTEHLQFCNDRAWEGNDFTFHIVIQNDSLTQTGVEKVEKINIDRLNIERYVRVK